MPQYLLMIKKRRWDYLEAGWLGAQEIQADPLGDLRIEEGNLSVWHIDDDKTNLDLVISALASARQSLDKFEYALFDQKLIRQINIQTRETPGNTPIKPANSWHRDLIHLTIDKTAQLVKAIFHNAEKRRLLEDDVKERIKKCVDQEMLDLQKIPSSFRNKLT